MPRVNTLFSASSHFASMFAFLESAVADEIGRLHGDVIERGVYFWLGMVVSV
jgi:pantoate kinase